MSTQVEQLEAYPPVSAELRTKILADPNVAKMAATLEVSVDELVNQIGYFMNNPGAEPAFMVVSDENLKKFGIEAPTPEAIEANIRKTIEAMKVAEAPSGFDAAPAKKGIDLNAKGPDQAAPAKADPKLAEELRRSRSGGSGSKG
jgi:hypothetical protein